MLNLLIVGKCESKKSNTVKCLQLTLWTKKKMKRNQRIRKLPRRRQRTTYRQRTVHHHDQRQKMLIHGVNAAGEALVVTKEGDMRVFKWIPYHPDARVNLLSQPQLVDQGCAVSYNSSKAPIDSDTFFVETPDGSRNFAFRHTITQSIKYELTSLYV